MEKPPLRDRFASAKERLGQLVLDGMEKMDDALDVLPDDTQEIDVEAVRAMLGVDSRDNG